MSTPFHVLIIDDSSKNTLLIKTELRKHWPALVSEQVVNARGLQAALKKQTWDCVLCGLAVPGFGALKALELLKKTNLNLPFIIVSVVVNVEDLVSLLKQGAHDFIPTDNLVRLVPAIEGARQDITERIEAEAALRASEA